MRNTPCPLLGVRLVTQMRLRAGVTSTTVPRFLSCTIILLSFNTLYTLSIYNICGFHPNFTPVTSDPTILFTNWSSSNLSMCPNHLNILCSAQPANSLIIPVLLRTSFLTQSIYVTPRILPLHLISSCLLLPYFMF